MRMKKRLVTALLVLGLVGSGGGAVLAAAGGNGKGGGGGNGDGSGKSQYCPPSSPGGGLPKMPHLMGNKCGHPHP
jgi:hypothetical protein